MSGVVNAVGRGYVIFPGAGSDCEGGECCQGSQCFSPEAVGLESLHVVQQGQLGCVVGDGHVGNVSL